MNRITLNKFRKTIHFYYFREMKAKTKKVKTSGNKPELLASKLIRTPKVLEELELLFDLAPPSFLKRSLTELFFSYMCNTETEDYKEDLKEICTDFYSLFKFLEVAEIYEREHEMKKLKNEN